jgi:hypothetical protein
VKVYGWIAMARPDMELARAHHRQVRCIVRAKSFAAASRAAEAVGLGRIHRDYYSTTGNPRELEVADEHPPETVLWRGLDDWGGEFRVLGPRDTTEGKETH